MGDYGFCDIKELVGGLVCAIYICSGEEHLTGDSLIAFLSLDYLCDEPGVIMKDVEGGDLEVCHVKSLLRVSEEFWYLYARDNTSKASSQRYTRVF